MNNRTLIKYNGGDGSGGGKCFTSGDTSGGGKFLDIGPGGGGVGPRKALTINKNN